MYRWLGGWQNKMIVCKEWEAREWEYSLSANSDVCPVCGAATKKVRTRQSQLSWCGYDYLYVCENEHRRIWSTRRAWEQGE